MPIGMQRKMVELQFAESSPHLRKLRRDLQSTAPSEPACEHGGKQPGESADTLPTCDTMESAALRTGYSYDDMQ